MTTAGSLWRPLRTPTFRNLLVADVLSDIGTFMQTVGAAWLMVSLGVGPLYVALTQTEGRRRVLCSRQAVFRVRSGVLPRRAREDEFPLQPRVRRSRWVTSAPPAAGVRRGVLAAVAGSV